MNYGFTGTQQGMTPAQKECITRLFSLLPTMRSVHHGDCIGADADIHEIARAQKLWIVVHPPDNDSKRAFVTGYNEIREAKPYLARNDDIVSETEVLIAAPKGYGEEHRSGTWATVRRARKQGKRIVIVWPDGRMTNE